MRPTRSTPSSCSRSGRPASSATRSFRTTTCSPVSDCRSSSSIDGRYRAYAEGLRPAPPDRTPRSRPPSRARLGCRLGRACLGQALSRSQIDRLQHGVDGPADGAARVAALLPVKPLESRTKPSRRDGRLGRRLHLTVANRTGWFVGAEDDAEFRNGDVDRAHRRREDAVVEQAATGAEHDRIRHQAEAVDELVLQ